MIVRPAASANIAQQRSVAFVDHAHSNVRRRRSQWRVDQSVHHIAQFDGPVAAFAQQIQRRDAGVRTHFVIHTRSAIEEEFFDTIQIRSRQFFTDAEPECLRNWRIDAVENRVCAAAFDPFGTAIGKQSTTGIGEFDAGAPFGAFQAFRQFEIGKLHDIEYRMMNDWDSIPRR